MGLDLGTVCTYAIDKAKTAVACKSVHPGSIPGQASILKSRISLESHPQRG
jgi:hypothetical protein